MSANHPKVNDPPVNDPPVNDPLVNDPINMDFSKTVLISSNEFKWIQSPAEGVTRCLFEREYSETGWACSLVSYAPQAKFPRHSHPGGEQFFVLEGSFSDHQGSFNANTFVQNAVGSFHEPFSEKGCLIFVKLGSLPSQAKSMVVPIDISQIYSQIKTDENNFFEIIKIPEDTNIQFSGCEVFILEGELEDPFKKLYPQYSWLRIASSDHIKLISNCPTRYLLSRYLLSR